MLQTGTEMRYNKEREIETFRQKLTEQVMNLSDEQASRVWRWLLCSKQENS